MLRRLTLGLLAIALVALAVLARVPRTGVGEAEAAGPVASISFSIVNTPVACELAGLNPQIVLSVGSGGMANVEVGVPRTQPDTPSQGFADDTVLFHVVR